jgi:hypothetical protein
MKTWINLLTMVVCVVLLCSGTSYAASAVLYTAPAAAYYPTTQTLYCDILNVNKASAAAKPVTIAILDYDGNAVVTQSFSLASGHGQSLGDSSGNGVYCRFTVDGAAKMYRAMAIYDNGSAYTVAVPAQ